MPSEDFSSVLTPQEKQRIRDDREKKRARNEEENLQDFFAESRGIEIGQTTSTRGKAHMRHGNVKIEKDKADREILSFSGLVFTATGVYNVLQALENSYILLSTKFAEKAAGTNTLSPHECKNYIYETVRVSPKTARNLEEEAAEIQEEIDKHRNAHDNKERAALAENILKLADKYQMRLHPGTNQYVHNIARVEEEEHAHNPHGNIECTGTVCVFRVRADIHADGRKMEQKIGDVNIPDKPVEVIVTGDHLKGPNAPQLHLN